MAPDEVQDVPEQGGKGARRWVAQGQEARPAILLHGQKATVKQLDEETGVSVDMQVGAGPGQQGQSQCSHLSSIVRKGGTG